MGRRRKPGQERWKVLVYPIASLFLTVTLCQSYSYGHLILETLPNAPRSNRLLTPFPQRLHLKRTAPRAISARFLDRLK
jgi:hypothetical protein